MLDLPLHRLELALFQPQIAPNVGNIGRLCVASGTPLHLVRPFGFILNDASLKRAGLDYWPRLKLTLHDDTDAFLSSMTRRTLWFFDSIGEISLFKAPFEDGDVLCLGSETRGIDPALLNAHRSRVIRIPQAPNERCLNLSTSAGIVLYQVLENRHRVITPRRSMHLAEQMFRGFCVTRHVTHQDLIGTESAR